MEPSDMSQDMEGEILWEEPAQNTYFKVMQLDLEGNLLTEFEILIPQDAGIHNVCADEAGNLYMLLCEYGKDMSSPEYVKDLFSLLAYSETGEELFRVQLGTGLEPDEWYYANELVCDKTQVYLRLIDKALESAKGVIVMIPEISLTPQILSVFHERYGDKVAVFHSALSSSFAFLFLSNAWLFVLFLLSQIANNTVLLAFTFETL